MKGQKTGGRKKGSINKIKPPQDVIRKVEAEAVANCIATGESPLGYMLRVMRDPTVEDPRRDEMARAAAPYVHARSVRKTRKRLTIIGATRQRILPTRGRGEGQADRGPGR
jgi:hypothetical protein